jgi:protein ImuA
MSIPAQHEILKHLAEQIRQCEGARRVCAENIIPSGNESLDQLLPEGGFRRGTLIEWVAAVPGSGATLLALTSAREACQDGRMLVVVDRRREFYPPAAASLGLSLEQMVIVRPTNAADEAWAMDQALRSAGVGAVLIWSDKLDDHTFRRWQLAAEASGAIGLLVRPAAARRSPSWAEVKLLVTPLDSPARRGWKLEILRCRGAECGMRSAECGVKAASELSEHSVLSTPYFAFRTGS